MSTSIPAQSRQQEEPSVKLALTVLFTLLYLLPFTRYPSRSGSAFELQTSSFLTEWDTDSKPEFAEYRYCGGSSEWRGYRL